MQDCVRGCTYWPPGVLEHAKPGPDVFELCGDVGWVEHDHGLIVYIGCEACNSPILLLDGHDLKAGWEEESFDRFSTA